MKKLLYPNMLRVLIASLLFILQLVSSQVFAQRDLLLYSTDFKDWTAVTYTNSMSSPIIVNSGAGEGFTITMDASVDPILGKYWIQGSTSGRDLITKPLTFISGGVLELEFELTGGGSNRIVTIASAQNASIVSYTHVSGAVDYLNLKAGTTTFGAVPTTNLDISKLGIWYTGSTIQLPRYGVGRCVVAFQLPTLTGNQSIVISGFRQDIPLRSLKVYSSVGATPYVATTNYPAAPANGLNIDAAVGGTKVTGSVNVKAWNLASTVSMSIVGSDASRFSLPVTTLTSMQALAGQNVLVEYMPSVKAGIHHAQLKLSAAGAPDFYMNLTGVSANGVAPEIIAGIQPIPFWTSLIANATNTIAIGGVNLTGNVSLAITGTAAASFSLPTNTITKAEALSGKLLTISFVGNVEPSTQTANLVISSPGANSITVPLIGYTSITKPVLYDLAFQVSPVGSGIIETSPAGSKFPAGTTVSVTATPETGYALDHWSDGKAGIFTTRNIVVSEMTSGMINAYFNVGTPTPPAASPLIGYLPINITATSFTAQWSLVNTATGYVVTVYNQDGSVHSTIPIASGLTTSVVVTGLNAGDFYSYSVETVGVTPAQITDKVGPFRTVYIPGVFPCVVD